MKVGVVQQRVLERLHRHCLDPNLRLSVILHQLGHCWSGRCCLLCQRLDESELGRLAKQMMLSTRRDEVKHITCENKVSYLQSKTDLAEQEAHV